MVANSVNCGRESRRRVDPGGKTRGHERLCIDTGADAYSRFEKKNRLQHIGKKDEKGKGTREGRRRG